MLRIEKRRFKKNFQKGYGIKKWELKFLGHIMQKDHRISHSQDISKPQKTINLANMCDRMDWGRMIKTKTLLRSTRNRKSWISIIAPVLGDNVQFLEKLNLAGCKTICSNNNFKDYVSSSELYRRYSPQQCGTQWSRLEQLHWYRPFLDSIEP